MKTFKQSTLLLMGLGLIIMLMLTALNVVAQDATEKKLSSENIPFGKELPHPDIAEYPGRSAPQMSRPNMNTALRQAVKSHDKNAIKKALDDYRQQLMDKRKEQTIDFPTNAADANLNHENSLNSNFHLLKAINALAESNPHNFPAILIDIHWYSYNESVSYAVLDNVIYFVADDGIHGNEF